MVRDKFSCFSGFTLEFLDTDYLGVLKAVRDKIHQGHGLLTHPLSGSVKPGETPYKTVIVTGERRALDTNVLTITTTITIIEESIQTCVKITPKTGKIEYNEKTLADFQLIDYNLIFG